jgi:hypothetical protein
VCFGEFAIPYKYLVREEFKEGMARGFQGIVGFSGTVLYYITVHRYRGLFYHSPFLILAVWGWLLMWKSSRWRSDALLCVSMVVAYLVFNASYYMWWGGWTNGPRHLIPALPFLVIPLIWVWKTGVLQRQMLVFLIMAGVFMNTVPALVDAQTPQNEPTRDLYHPAVAEDLRPKGDSISEIGVQIVYEHRAPLSDPLWASLDRQNMRLCGIKGFVAGNVAKNAGHLLGLSGHETLLPLLIVWFGFLGALAFLVRSSTINDDVQLKT